MVLNNPFDYKKDPLNHDIFERFFTHIDIVKKRKEFVESVHKEVWDKIRENLNDTNPELLTSFTHLYQECTLLTKAMEKQMAQIEKKTKKIVESSSLCEDVYKLRDEVCALKKKIDKFNSSIRKLANMAEDDEK